MSANGIVVYDVNKEAFLENVRKVYAEEGQDADWPEGLMDRIVAVGK